MRFARHLVTQKLDEVSKITGMPEGTADDQEGHLVEKRDQRRSSHEAVRSKGQAPSSRDPRAIAAHVSLSSRSLVKEPRAEPSNPKAKPSNTGQTKGPATQQDPYQGPIRSQARLSPNPRPQKTARQPIPNKGSRQASSRPRHVDPELGIRKVRSRHRGTLQTRFASQSHPQNQAKPVTRQSQIQETEPPAGTTSPQRRRRWTAL